MPASGTSADAAAGRYDAVYRLSAAIEWLPPRPQQKRGDMAGAKHQPAHSCKSTSWLAAHLDPDRRAAITSIWGVHRATLHDKTCRGHIFGGGIGRFRS